MLFLVDAQLPSGLADRLNNAGYSAVHLFDLLPEQATDKQIAIEANRRKAVIISKDQDFADLAVEGFLVTSCVWLRTGNMTTRRLWQVLEPLLPSIVKSCTAGERVVEVRT